MAQRRAIPFFSSGWVSTSFARDAEIPGAFQQGLSPSHDHSAVFGDSSAFQVLEKLSATARVLLVSIARSHAC